MLVLWLPSNDRVIVRQLPGFHKLPLFTMFQPNVYHTFKWRFEYAFQ